MKAWLKVKYAMHLCTIRDYGIRDQPGEPLLDTSSQQEQNVRLIPQEYSVHFELTYALSWDTAAPND